ncbi:hypothetical protein [Pseudoalteromonas phenolica]|uniref:hypothetical protein n=1 Tax=Pseudoalteromonas phenolica TaxID=161398 RepID=UPI00110ABB64|nr:hypothetical protein [Pseudoalteromonas phenolica]TMO54087.1 hypothetical protein CWC21_16510 [Pseudoalteromonas phenolica]|tara:strand:- start:5456 stop:5818 length:363 start_codon:yes stop_codon:yes gene_type:complete
MIAINSKQYEQFVWADEFAYTLIAEQKEYALNGAAHIEKTAKVADRPITLVSIIESADVFNELFNFGQTQLDPFIVNIRGSDYSVTFDHSEQPVIGQPIQIYSDTTPDFFENVTIKLRTV